MQSTPCYDKIKSMVKAVIQLASHYCEKNKHRLTEPRLAVIEIIAASTKPISAYEILATLGKVTNNPKPPTVYRAIEFWQKIGFIHRIESLNAYVACEAGHQHNGTQFMICDDCGTVTEKHLCELPETLKDSTVDDTFTPSRWYFEIHGVCKACL